MRLASTLVPSQRLGCVMSSTTIHAFVAWNGLEGVRQLTLAVVSSSMIPKLLAFFEGYVTECAEVLGY